MLIKWDLLMGLRNEFSVLNYNLVQSYIISLQMNKEEDG